MAATRTLTDELTPAWREQGRLLTAALPMADEPHLAFQFAERMLTNGRRALRSIFQLLEAGKAVEVRDAVADGERVWRKEANISVREAAAYFEVSHANLFNYERVTGGTRPALETALRIATRTFGMADPAIPNGPIDAKIVDGQLPLPVLAPCAKNLKDAIAQVHGGEDDPDVTTSIAEELERGDAGPDVMRLVLTLLRRPEVASELLRQLETGAIAQLVDALRGPVDDLLFSALDPSGPTEPPDGADR